MQRVDDDVDVDVDNRHGVIEGIEGGWKATVVVTDEHDKTAKRRERTFILVRWFITNMVLMMVPVLLAVTETLCCRRWPS
jgi:hypothetical protein